ncbi:probable L-cysteine desulfhydrase, chloroplastic [Tanacetum coccineum]
MWDKFRYKEIVDNRNGKWLFKFSNEVGMVTVASQSPWMVNNKPLMVQKWDPSIGMTKTEPTKIPVWVKLTDVNYDWNQPICAHCLVFGHDHKSCKVRARTNEEIATEKESADKNVGNQKENEFVHNKVRRPVWNTRISRPGNYGRNNYMSGEGSKRFTGCNKQQWNKKVSNNEENNANKNKEKSTKEEIPVQSNKNQNVKSSNKDSETSNNSFFVLKDLDDDNIQGMNMLKDKIIVDTYLNIKLQPSLSVTKNWSQEMMNYFRRSWEADREKERNERLDDMEDFVEDVFEEEGIAAKNLVVDELKGASSSLLN